ncbi:hypothetical protein FOA52_012007 [Chlamydomonas sp. UWO 241]|nr:hypothetical protein FOA52_012007 [Chlamydomonas sp. UWO 241]
MFSVKLAEGLYKGWDLQAVMQIFYTGIYLTHWLVALFSRRRSSNNTSGSNKLAAALRWLFVDHVRAFLHIARNMLLLTLTAFNANISWSGPQDAMALTACYGALAAVMEPNDLATSLVVNWAVLLPRSVIQFALLSRREELSLATIVVFSLLRACTMAAIHIAVARCSATRMQPLWWRRAGVRTHSNAPADVASGASGGSETDVAPLLATSVASASTLAPATAATEANTSSATLAAGSARGAGGGVGPLIYRSLTAGNASKVQLLTKFPTLHLSQHSQLSTPEGLAALQARLERRASEVLSRLRGQPMEVRLAQFYVAAGCVVVGGIWHVSGAGGVSEQEMRVLVEEVLLGEMLQEVDPAPKGMRTTGCILDSTSDMWQLGSDDDDESAPEQPTLHVETGGACTPVAPPAMEGVQLLVATTPLQALPPHDNGRSRVSMQFATPLLARALGRDPELIISFAPAGGASAPLASLLRARVCDLQTVARARGKPPGLMDVDIHLGGVLAGAAREYGGMFIAQLVDGPTMLAAVPVPLLPCAARPAVAELSRLGLDLRTTSHIACDLGLFVPWRCHVVLYVHAAIHRDPRHARAPRAAGAAAGWLSRADSSLMRRLYNLMFSTLSAQAFGHIPPGVSNLLRTSKDIPFWGMFDFGEPLHVRVWWVRAALSAVLIVPPQLVMMCAHSGEAGSTTLCSRQAWGTFTSKVDLLAFLAPRVAMPFVANAAIWLSARARSGGKSKQE